ncbi:phosphatidylinositol 4-phosphate 5-kinase type-1 alpha isoform X1 [Patella vulgata]|uniref:phosphatidylinositol 4-phosphate 5-kinase type-1 alpha isoform X1 n=2 Tax=Patella vulgata TaxID=6465 RepID=UPI0021802E2C|nr:phosphatidylinositol 4-phosphate 5-kinase type-1 alpha isoform X1 [Patella vulgata]
MATAAEIRQPGPMSMSITDDGDTEQLEETIGYDKTEKQGSLDVSMASTGPGAKGLRDRKLGHRRVDHAGVVTYKKKPTSELMAAIQLGMGQSIGGLSSKPERDVLMQDFAVVESVFFPKEGSNLTPAHQHSDYRFKTYAPVAFRYFRELFGIQPDDFMMSLCDEPLQELSNPGASGSIFYITQDDEFIIKTVQHKEADFLTKLLPGYFLNHSQNPRTLLPKYYGLYCYQCGGKNIRFTVMNNLLPSSIKMHEKYDLKGSTYKRKASKSERAKSNPTLKDLDFNENHPEGILMEKEYYDALIKTLNRDIRVLESFKIMDFSLLVGIHNLDAVEREKGHTRVVSECSEYDSGYPHQDSVDTQQGKVNTSLQRGKSFKTRLAQYSTALESITAKTDIEENEDENFPPGGIPARNQKGDRLLIYLGIIDILQSYRLKKRLEHQIKSLVIDGDTISVHRPGYYANRFASYCATRVFKKIQTPLKHSPSKKKGYAGRARAQTTIPEQTEPGSAIRKVPEKTQRTISFSDEYNPSVAMSGKPDLLPDASNDTKYQSNPSITDIPTTQQSSNINNKGDRLNKRNWYRSEVMTSVVYRSDDSMRIASAIRNSPPLSLSESTPTHTDHTEGTPSFTTSSPSCSSDVLGNLCNKTSRHDFTTNTDSGLSPASLSPEKASPSKKASSSEASYSSALEQQVSSNVHTEKEEVTHL